MWETVEQVTRMVGVSAALTTGLTLLVGVGWKMTRFVYKTMKYAEHAHETIARVDTLVEKQLTNNGGDSMLDMMQEVRHTVRHLDKRLTVLENK